MTKHDLKCVALSIDCRPQTREFIEQEWHKAVERVENWIRKASIYITDTNGPRGGICKRCRIILYPHSGGPIVIQDTQERLSPAISSAIKRSVNTLKRRIARKRQRRRRAASPIEIEQES